MKLKLTVDVNRRYHRRVTEARAPAATEGSLELEELDALHVVHLVPSDSLSLSPSYASISSYCVYKQTGIR